MLWQKREDANFKAFEEFKVERQAAIEKIEESSARLPKTSEFPRHFGGGHSTKAGIASSCRMGRKTKKMAIFIALMLDS